MALISRETHDGFYIAWFDSTGSEDVEGAWIGERYSRSNTHELEEKRKQALSRRDWEEFETIAVELEAWHYCKMNRRWRLKDGAWVTDSEREARALLRRLHAAMKVAEADYNNVKWPSWARRALAEGWKPPKGWKA